MTTGFPGRKKGDSDPLSSRNLRCGSSTRRSSTATQSLLRQRHILTEAALLVRTEGIAAGFRPAEGVLRFEDPATTSKIPALERPAFAKVAAAAHPGDVLTVSELFRLCRDLIDIHAVRNWCQARGVALRVLSGPLSNFHDLAANDATTALLINVITAVGQFQRDLQNELTAEGIAAAEAEGRYRGRPPGAGRRPACGGAIAFADRGTSIAALARTHGVSRAAIRTALTGLLPGQPNPPSHIPTEDTCRRGQLSYSRVPPTAVRRFLNPVARCSSYAEPDLSGSRRR
ncbi:recombinase family protein [Nonomuraea sp. JJY05]|uniref:recombinase family protein n=1 Tax=Nonomuraea sp. JJY05 TaxID=3350255 RepID=UPI00373F7156